MNRISITLVCLFLIIISSYVTLPKAEAEVFDIGEKVSESDFTITNFPGMKWYYFDSDCMVYANPDFINYTHLIFDGNLSTGIDHDFGSGKGVMFFIVQFPYPIYVSNFTFYHKYHDNSTRYHFAAFVKNSQNVYFDVINSTKTLHINGTITGFEFRLYYSSGETEHIYFNDVIINYTKRPTDLNEILYSIDGLNKKINDLNGMINITNNSHEQVWDNITDIWSEFDNLNKSITNMLISIDNLNNSFYENITRINNNLTTIEKELYNIKLNISNLSSNVSKISKLQESINQLFLDVKYINENITDIKNNLPDEYNDTDLKDRIFKLEANNSDLNEKIKNLTSEFESEKAELNKKIDELNSTLNDLKGSGKDVQGKDQQFDYSVLALILVIIIIVIHLVTTVFVKRADSHELESMPESNILKEVITDALKRDNEIDKQPFNKEIKRKLDEKYQKGEISKEAYEYSLDHINNQHLMNNIPKNENTK